MLTLLSTAWAWVKSLFISPAAGIIWKTILSGIGTKVVNILTDKKVQTQAWNIAVTLRDNKEMSGLQKAVEFNKQMAAWLQENGYLSVTTRVINAIRELAVQAIDVKDEQNETVALQPMK